MLKYILPILLIASPLQAQTPPPPAQSGVAMVSYKCPHLPVRFPNVEVAVAFVKWSYDTITDEDLFFVVSKTPELSVEFARRWVTACKGLPS